MRKTVIYRGGACVVAITIGLWTADVVAMPKPVPRGTAGLKARARMHITAVPTAHPDHGSGHDTTHAAGFDALNVSLLSRIPAQDFGGGSSSSNDCWGYTSPSGREYAIVGNQRGVGFAEVTNPTAPVILGEIAHVPSGWSDQGTFQEYCYSVNESGGGLQVIDMTQIDNGIVLEAPANPNQFSTSHNVWVNMDSGFAYPCSTNVVSGMIAYDLSDPANPVTNPAWTWNEKRVHDLYVLNYNDCPYAGRAGPCEIAFASCGGAGLYIIDVTDKAAMTTISISTYPTLAFAHQGHLSEDRHFFFLDDESDELSFGLPSTTYVFDVQDLANPQFLTSFTNGIPSIDHNLYVRGHFTFSANYTSGLRIFDISNPLAGHEVGYFDTSAFGFLGFGGAWGVYPLLPSGVVLISDMENGLFVLDPIAATGCLSDLQCNDANDCTTDSCGVGGVCLNVDVAAGVACDDGDSCTINGSCDNAGTCVSTPISSIPCVDDGPCAPGSCDTATGFCTCITCVAVDPPLAEDVIVAKNRFVAFTPTNPGVQTALQLVYANLPPPYDVYNGMSMWIAPPTAVSEIGGQVTPPPGGASFMAATLDCQPHVMDWGSVGKIHVYHATIVPGGDYVVRASGEGCVQGGIPTFSTALPVATADWGDTVKDLSTIPPGPPDGDVSILDILAIIGRFVSSPDAVLKARADLEPGEVDLLVNISDALLGLTAFTGVPFPFDPPDPPPPCP